MAAELKENKARCELAESDNLGHTRCALCGIRPYSFCRCLNEEELKVFSTISSERMFSDKQMFFCSKRSQKIYIILPKVI